MPITISKSDDSGHISSSETVSATVRNTRDYHKETNQAEDELQGHLNHISNIFSPKDLWNKGAQ